MPALLQRLADGHEKCEWQRLVKDVHGWRAVDNEFREQLDALAPKAFGPDPFEAQPGMEDWKLRWAEQYLETRDKVESSRRVGLSWTYVYAHLRPKSTRFDPYFAELVGQVESTLLASTEADIHLAMRIARETADAKTLLFGAFTYLEKRSRSKWGKEQTVNVKGGTHSVVEHRVVVAMAGAKERSARLFAPPREAVPAPAAAVDVVDVVIVR